MEIIRIFERKCLRICLGMRYNDDRTKLVSNAKLYEKAEIIRIDNFLIKLALKFCNSLYNIDNDLLENIIEQEVSLNDKVYSTNHLILLNENNLLYNDREEIIYYTGRFNPTQYVPT